jgi:hypothetical protein
MRRLRQKVEVDPNHPAHLQTVRGIGYRLVAVRAADGPVDDGAPGQDPTDEPDASPSERPATDG